MPASAVVTVMRAGEGNIIEAWDKTIDRLTVLLKTNEENLKKFKTVQTLKTLFGEDLSKINLEVKQCDWVVRQNAFQIKFKTLERQMFRMMLAKTFDSVEAAFLTRYNEMCHHMCDLWEEGVELDEMTEADYREMVDDLMKYRNYIHGIPTPE